jgi:hypothetical protein
MTEVGPLLPEQRSQLPTFASSSLSLAGADMPLVEQA